MGGSKVTKHSQEWSQRANPRPTNHAAASVRERANATLTTVSLAVVPGVLSRLCPSALPPQEMLYPEGPQCSEFRVVGAEAFPRK